MKLTTEQVMAHVKAKKSANINNINNNNNITTTNNEQLNNITTLTTKTTLMNSLVADIHKEISVQRTPSALLASFGQKEPVQEIPDSRSGIGSLALKILPDNWRGLKVDLFLNMNRSRSSLRCVYNIIRLDGTKANIRASLSGRARDATRGVSEEELTRSTWIKFRQLKEQLKDIDPNYKVSKFYLPGKKGSLSDMITFLVKEHEIYTSILIYYGEIYTYCLDGDLSTKFESNNGIATQYFGLEGITMKMISPKDLGL